MMARRLLGQPTIIKSLEKQFGERVAKKKMTVTPGTPGFIGGKVDDILTEVGNLQGIYPLKDEWVFGCSLKTRLADQTKTQQLKWLWSKDSMDSTINQILVEQTQEINFKLDGSGGSTLGDTLRKQYLSSSDEKYFVLFQDCENMMSMN